MIPDRGLLPSARTAADFLMLAVLAWIAFGAAIESNVPFVFPALGLLAMILGWVVMEMRVGRARLDGMADRLARIEERTSTHVTEAALALRLQDTRHALYERQAELQAAAELKLVALEERLRELERTHDRTARGSAP